MKKWIGILSCFICLSAHGASNLPNLGDPAYSALSPQEEQALGVLFLREIHNQSPVVDDPIISNYIQYLGYDLVAYSDEPDRPFHFIVVHSKEINAFAGPGGNIVITTGLILTTDTVDELAGVLAHEISHVTQHHLARSFAASQRQTLPMVAAVLAAAAVAGPLAIPAALTGAFAYHAETVLSYTRENEKEADAQGIQLLKAAGFNPDAVGRFFKELDKNNQYNELNIPAFLRTHPVTGDRIAEASLRARQLGITKDRIDEDYGLIKSRIRAFIVKDPKQYEEQLAAKLKKKPHSLALQYEYALLQRRLHNMTNAQKRFEQLHKQHPDNTIITFGLLNTYDEMGKYKIALPLAKEYYHYNPDYYPAVVAYLELLMKSKKPQEALAVLDELPDAPAFYMYRAEAYAKLGKPVESDIERAKGHAAMGNYPVALKLLRMAKHKKPLSTQAKHKINTLEKRYREMV